MTTLTKEQEQYIEQEVKIRLHDEKFQIIERDFNEIKTSIHYLDTKIETFIKHLDGKFDSQFKWIIGLFASSIVIPVVLHFVKALWTVIASRRRGNPATFFRRPLDCFTAFLFAMTDYPIIM